MNTAVSRREVSQAEGSDPEVAGVGAPRDKEVRGKRGNRTYAKHSYRWHRRIGVLICVPALSLAITGLFLNHSKMFGLETTYITNPAILEWYGMKPQNEPISLRSDDHWLVLMDDTLYVDEKAVAQTDSAPTGAVELDEMLVVATVDSVLLLDNGSKALIEKLGREALPEGDISAIGVSNQRLLLDTSKGTFIAPPDISGFYPDKRERLASLIAAKLPQDLFDKILEDWRGRGISLWRLLLDVHSGSFFGRFGTILTDISAFCIIGLVFSGIYTWSKRSTR